MAATNLGFSQNRTTTLKMEDIRIPEWSKRFEYENLQLLVKHALGNIHPFDIKIYNFEFYVNISITKLINVAR